MQKEAGKMKSLFYMLAFLKIRKGTALCWTTEMFASHSLFCEPRSYFALAKYLFSWHLNLHFAFGGYVDAGRRCQMKPCSGNRLLMVGNHEPTEIP